jgi:type I restriction enzyme S subunit
MGHIQRKHLTEALCVVPPLPKIKQLDSLIALLLGQQIERRMEVQTLATLRDTLLHKLLSGEMCI